jgi:dihydrofolate synthase/folylpolyglutamate synthase
MRFDNLHDWLRWQDGLHPSKIELGLDRVQRVWSRLGPKDLPFPVLSIAGTNGKGSCAAMLDAVYSAGGYRTVCYTSPHLLRYNERVRIEGREVSDHALCEAFERVDAARGTETLTYFEFGTLAAMDLFVRASPDVAILEVGLGGRLDAVNLFDANIALITSIGRDHAAWLGETLEEIAREKAGIYRPGRPVVIGHRDPTAPLLEQACALGCPTHRLGREYDFELEPGGWRWMGPGLPALTLEPPSLRGKAQYDNAAAVLMCAFCLRDKLPLSLGNLRQGLQRARIPGRFEVLPGKTTWILDVAHNEPAATLLSENLASLRCTGRKHVVLGMLADKEPETVAAPLMEWADIWHLGASDDPRAMSTDRLSKTLRGLRTNATLRIYGSIRGAVLGAHDAAERDDCVLAYGSFTTVEAAKRHLSERYLV